MFFSELDPTINASTHQKSTTKETPRSNSILAIDCSSRALLPLLSAYFTGNFQLCIKNSGNDENFIDSAITDLYIEHIIFPIRASQEITKAINAKLGHLYNSCEIREYDASHVYIDLTTNSNHTNPIKSTCLILFTSGSSGERKGVHIPKKALTNCAKMMNNEMKISNTDNELIIGQLDHAFVIGRLLSAAMRGASFLYIDTREALNPKSIIEALINGDINSIACMPSLLYSLLKISKIKLLLCKHIRFAQIGAMHLSGPKKLELTNVLSQAKIFTHYGMTEYMRATFFNISQNKEKLHTEGPPSPGTNIRINAKSLDAKSNEFIPGQIVGEIEIFGPSLCEGYTDKNAWKHKLTNDGYLKSNDIGYLDSDGFLIHLGRKDNMCNINGKLISIALLDQKIKDLMPEYEDNIALIAARSKNNVQDFGLYIFLSKEAQKEYVRKFISQLLSSENLSFKVIEIDSLPRLANEKLNVAELKSSIQ